MFNGKCVHHFISKDEKNDSILVCAKCNIKVNINEMKEISKRVYYGDGEVYRIAKDKENEYVSINVKIKK